ncbi:BTAD domain-containing putative transcriptional regulator [Lentzea flaviverrucosa]|uniref:DNA-binding transcriptional activator of the SARP family n=1 Tax=Lentzea flaviverrucosa TaxID=200379 RepID=A0A1H9BUT8_9PSEU|nr:BTAD domain-containing putative transcriptional regulator [Lentzea flaviverrucosa]RDI31674.1 DNA-binding SARP family transcriptional activator [Lentzea flaviverrucosa]SEP92343.1 DNA-binding transcriptional activator of the SARP family [Lentzea flaviverrucosa]
MTEYDAAALRAALREQRKNSGLTQSELARLSGVSVRTIRHIELGHVVQPRHESVRRLFAVLGPPATRTLAIDLLGPLVVRRGGVLLIRSPQQRALVGLLALQPTGIVSHAEIVDVLWGHAPPVTHRELLYAIVSRLRRHLGDTAIETLSSGYRLNVDLDQVDVCRFAEQSARARNGGDLRAFVDALGLWRGPVLADLPEALRQHSRALSLQQQRIATTVAFADRAFADCGAGVLPWLADLAESEPWHEELHARLILVLASNGRQADAIFAYQRIRDRLDRDLGLLPGPALKRAHESVLRQEAPLLRPKR